MMMHKSALVVSSPFVTVHRVCALACLSYVMLVALLLACPRRLLHRRLVAWSLAGEPVAATWAGWSMCGALQMAMHNLHVRSDVSAATLASSLMLVDVLAIRDAEHWTWLVHVLLALDAATLVLSARPQLTYSIRLPWRFRGAVHLCYVALGAHCLASSAPLLMRNTRLAGEPLSAAFAGWRMSTSAFYVMVNFGYSLSLGDAVGASGAAAVALELARSSDGEFNPVAAAAAAGASAVALLACVHLCGMGWVGVLLDDALRSCLCLGRGQPGRGRSCRACQRSPWGRVATEEPADPDDVLVRNDPFFKAMSNGMFSCGQ